VNKITNKNCTLIRGFCIKWNRNWWDSIWYINKGYILFNNFCAFCTFCTMPLHISKQMNVYPPFPSCPLKHQNGRIWGINHVNDSVGPGNGRFGSECAQRVWHWDSHWDSSRVAAMKSAETLVSCVPVMKNVELALFLSRCLPRGCLRGWLAGCRCEALCKLSRSWLA
jgi:hypothetical protein